NEFFVQIAPLDWQSCRPAHPPFRPCPYRHFRHCRYKADLPESSCLNLLAPTVPDIFVAVPEWLQCDPFPLPQCYMPVTWLLPQDVVWHKSWNSKLVAVRLKTKAHLNAKHPVDLSAESAQTSVRITLVSKDHATSAYAVRIDRSAVAALGVVRASTQSYNAALYSVHWTK